MADYINREKLLEHIKDVPTWEIDDKGVHDTKYPKGMFDCEDVVSSIENAPAADVEHVIRCKDCKWYERDKLKGGFCRKPEASMWSPGLPIDELKPDDYCSRAKRKENINGN